jgi:hypothetical protein
MAVKLKGKRVAKAEDAIAGQASFAVQSPFTDPGAWTCRLEDVQADLVSIRDASRRLVYHFWAGDFEQNGIAPERIAEIDTRYAESMFDRLFRWPTYR